MEPKEKLITQGITCMCKSDFPFCRENARRQWKRQPQQLQKHYTEDDSAVNISQRKFQTVKEWRMS